MYMRKCSLRSLVLVYQVPSFYQKVHISFTYALDWSRNILENHFKIRGNLDMLCGSWGGGGIFHYGRQSDLIQC